jgi:integrase
MPKRRSSWNLQNGKWSRSIGERGARVRLFQKTKDGVFYRATWVRSDDPREPCGRRNVRSLGTRDRNHAERLGRALLAALLAGDPPLAPEVLTLAHLWERYRESAGFLDNDRRTQDDAAMRADVLIAYFGHDRDVATLTGKEQLAFEDVREHGGIRVVSERIRDDARESREWTTRAARPRTVEADLVLLHGMLKWATCERDVHGRPLLAFHPLAGVRIDRERNPRRPVATSERYERTRTAIQQLHADATSDRERRRWLKLDMALVLAKQTGRRLGAIRQLQWTDIGFDAGTIRWRAQTDKKGVEWVIPVPAAVLDALRQFRHRLGVISEWVFPAEKDAKQAMGRDQFDAFLRIAESKAELPKLDGGLWHPYRRGWATAKKHLPVVDVANAGGWSSPHTLLRCYQQPDNETLLAVMSDPTEVKMWRGGTV